MERLIFPITRKEAEKQGQVYSSKVNKDALFPSQLRELREKKGVSQAVLAHDLGISKSTIGLYETGDTLPDARTLHDLAVYFDVSADYLLGLSKIPSTDTNIKAICEYTGLTPATVNNLHTFSHDSSALASFIARFFEDIMVFGVTDIEFMCEQIVKSAQANAISKEIRATDSLSDLHAEFGNLIAIVNQNHDGKFSLSAKDAAGYFLGLAQNSATSHINSIIETMMEELSEQYFTAGTTQEKCIAWELYEDSDSAE